MLYSRYQYKLNASPVQWQSRIEDVSLKGDFTWYLNPGSTFRFGGQSIHHRINPGSSKTDTVEASRVSVPGRQALEHALYMSHEQQLSERFLLESGLRYSLVQNLGKSTVFSYNSLYQPIDTTTYPAGQVYHTQGNSNRA
jgi:outer membrane receptor for ferrienterochelin and colicin